MTRIQGAVLIAALFATTATAQRTPVTTSSRGGLAVKGGFSYGNVSNSGLLPGDARRRNGAAVGLALYTGGTLGLGMEGLYAERGIIGSAPGTSRELDYIDVPVYLRIAAENPQIEPFIYAGPQISWEIRCDAGGGTCPSGRSKTTYAGVIGAGLRLAPLSGLSIEGRYLYGLSDLRLGTVSDRESYRTRSFMILLGFGS